MTAKEILEAGYLGSLDAVVQLRELAGDPHSGAGGRAYAAALAGGLSFEVLPERGLDIGAAWFAGQPVGWRSALGSAASVAGPAGWLGRFGGGLLVTCGLDNIGSSRAGYGQHGSHHDTRAHDVAVTRISSEDGAPGVRIAGTVDSVEVFGRRVRLHRTITSFADDPALRIADRVVNEGAWPAPVALLYHINFGAPLVLPGTRVEVDADDHQLREPSEVADDWSVYPEPADRLGEAVWRHSRLRTSDGIAAARVSSPTGLTAEVSWRAAELPDLVEWVFPPRNTWALGIEPCNAPLWGPAREADDAGMPVLAAGEEFETEVTVRFSNSEAVR